MTILPPAVMISAFLLAASARRTTVTAQGTTTQLLRDKSKLDKVLDSTIKAESNSILLLDDLHNIEVTTEGMNWHATPTSFMSYSQG